ncbi:hypothetical protein AcW1_009774 [Taiwanofungus camphoratus]|nr:hypothetical protein AcW1_009774 [Antrodia cinnamomea]
MPPSYSPCPRSILKRPSTQPEPERPSPRDEPTQLLAIDPGVLQPLVRFPPHASLTRTFSAHSPAQYDRSPIVVQPNRCALPERGSRTYTLDDAGDDNDNDSECPRMRLRASGSRRPRSPPGAGRHLHPRAALATDGLPLCFEDDRADDDDEDPTPQATPLAHHHPLPPLVPDLSSESDESDGFASPPGEPALHPHPRAWRDAPGAYTRTGLSMSMPMPRCKGDVSALDAAQPAPPRGDALSFLPHPHSPTSPPRTRPAPPTSPARPYPHAPEGGDERPRHRHAHASPGPPPPGRERKRHARASSRSPEAYARYKALSEKSALSGCGLAMSDMGCLDGF